MVKAIKRSLNSLYCYPDLNLEESKCLQCQPCLTMINCTVGCEKVLEEHIVELRQARQCKYVKPNIKVVDLVFQVEKMLLLAIDS